MDLSETYRSIVRKFFPNALIVADRFHVVRLVNHHFLRLWQQHDPVGRKNRGLLSLMRRHYWKLDPGQQLALQAYLAQWPVLEALYRAKQRLMSLLLVKTVNARMPNAAQAHEATGAIRSKPSQNPGCDLEVMEAHRGNVEVLQVQRDHRRVSY